MLASKAQRCSELDKLKYIEPYYSLNDYEVIFRTQEDPVICYQCKSTYHTDLFLTMDGMACRQCIASCIMHQLRLSLFPLEISLFSPNDRPLDLLHALLPVSLVSLIIEVRVVTTFTANYIIEPYLV
ncbi:hypothetical protein OESDEN_22608 [Oesophagostomum dentatum]|uniref:Uncharacterized protein n=1 Tax=Oesophagostomum dentatum TaxID=61180 RepID=A0A0B1S2Q3_OESDE|nr:hypothetical protein OESDEN_22608 [Oesophagostomum dentatum]